MSTVALLMTGGDHAVPGPMRGPPREHLRVLDGLEPLRAVVDMLPVGVLVIEGQDADGAVVAAHNPAFADTIGMSLPAGTPFKALPFLCYPPDRQAPIPTAERPSIRALERGEVVRGVELHLLREDGEWRVVLASASPVYQQGHIVGAVVMHQDITERKQVEQALRESEERFRTLADNAPDIITRFDHGLRHLYVNRVAKHATGLPCEAFIGKSNEEVGMPAELVSFWNEHFLRVFDTGQPTSMEFQYEGPEGPRWYEARLVPEFRVGGAVASVLAITRDVTERRRMEDALRQSEARERARATELQTVLDAVPAAVLITHERESRLIEGNRFCSEILGVPAGTNASMSVPPEERPAVFKVMKDGVELAPEQMPIQVAAASGLEVRGFEFSLAYKDGRMKHLLGNAVPLRDEQGQIQGAVGAFVDITDRKRAEEALRAEDRRKTEFLAVLSHELRNPLAPIRYSLYVLEHAEPGSAQAHHAQAVIHRQVTHMARLVDDLLDATRIARGKIELQLTRLELGELVRRAEEDHRATYAASGVALELRLPRESLWLEADATRLAQVVGNLLHNAVKFTPRGGRVRLSLERSGAQAVLSVRDTGAGIEPELLDHIFEPFTQADRTLDRSQSGLGLGLALVKGLVELHGGSVCARSEGPGFGAEFRVLLPLEVASKEAPAPVGEAPVRQRRRVLVIEDNLDGASVLREAVELMGHEVEVAYDGARGLEAARRFQPDIVLCDIGLPGMDGYAVARAFRADDVLRVTTLVAVTGYALPEDRQRAAEAGFSRHLAKPPSLDELERLLGR